MSEHVVSDFKGKDDLLIQSIDSLLAMDAKGILVPHGIGGHARTLLRAAKASIEQACAARTVPEGCMVVNAKWLERHAGPEDHACVRCYPHSDMLIDGFSCYYHKALDVIAAAPEPKK